MKGRLYNPEFCVFTDDRIGRMICCCNLICLLSSHQIYVCNPSTQQLLKLPQPPRLSFNHGVLVRFGYVPSKNVCKVVDWFSEDPNDSKRGCMVFTLHEGGGNSGAWRVIADCPNPTELLCHRRRACVNGTLYWGLWGQRHGGSPEVLTLDLVVEKFGIIQYPPHNSDYF